MNIRKKINKLHSQRAKRVRAKIYGTGQKPRLSVFKSNNFVYLQLVDDSSQKTILSISTRQAAPKSKKIEGAKTIGEKIAKMAKEKGIKEAIFDRGRYKYHGVIKTIVEAARKNGLKI
jgi:large subunit ribosomal protein L18